MVFQQQSAGRGSFGEQDKGLERSGEIAKFNTDSITDQERPWDLKKVRG